MAGICYTISYMSTDEYRPLKRKELIQVWSAGIVPARGVRLLINQAGVIVPAMDAADFLGNLPDDPDFLISPTGRELVELMKEPIPDGQGKQAAAAPRDNPESQQPTPPPTE